MEAEAVADSSPKSPEKNARRKIPGNFVYTTAPGALRRVVEQIPIVEKPSVMNSDFLSTVMQVSGGSARPIVPILKSCGLLSQSGAPTEIYSQFQTESGRPAAALLALKAGFSEIFKRNQYAHKADDNSVIDLIVSITGLPKSDQIVRAIFNTFQVFQVYARDARSDELRHQPTVDDASDFDSVNTQHKRERNPEKIGLSYNINIVLPETTNIEIYNAIFRSLKGNLL